MIKQLHFVKTKKYGTVVVTNTKEYKVYDDEGVEQPELYMPAGMVCRWLPEGKDEPLFKVIKDVFTKDFDNDDEKISKYIDENNLLDNTNY